MSLNIPIISVPLLTAALLIAPCFVQAQQKDRRGSKDHPLVSRYPGSVITAYSMKEYDVWNVPLGNMSRGWDKWTKTERIEGKITCIEYRNPKERSALEIFRNYEAAFKQAGFRTLFTCMNEECGPGSWGGADPLNKGWRRSGPQGHLTVLGSRPEGDVYLSLHVNAGATNLTVGELESMESGLVTVNAAVLAGELGQTGHTAIYGIYFDTGKADVKPESEPAITEIVKLLNEDPSLKLYVVGHTDNVGTLPMNMDLSRHRAAAVVDALTSQHGIPAARLHAEGMGPLSPVESNDTEEGRSRNRRVELVKQ